MILALLAEPLLLPLKQQATERATRHTERTLQVTQEALLAYAALTGGLPCPDFQVDSGQAEYGLAANTCTATGSPGWLPFRSLGLREGDAWFGLLSPPGGRLVYWVDPAFTRQGNTLPSLTTPPSTPNTSVFDALGRKLTSDAEPPIAILYSLGPNGRADGLNSPTTGPHTAFESHPPMATFDDQLIWIGRPTLFSVLIRSGQAH